MNRLIKLLKKILSINTNMPFQKLEKDIIIPPYITKLAISKVRFSYDEDTITCWIDTNIREEYPVLARTLDGETTKIKYY